MDNITEKELVLMELLAVERNIADSLKHALATSNAGAKVMQAEIVGRQKDHDKILSENDHLRDELQNGKANWQKLYDENKRLREIPQPEWRDPDAFAFSKTDPPKGY